MLRGIIYALVSILVLTFVRGVIGILTKGVQEAMREESPQQAKAPKGGELVKCPICDTYFAPDTQHRKVSDGKLHVFCSEKCLGKFVA